jgi:H+/Cl- antiporter ClcA
MPKALGELARQLWNWCTLVVLFLMLSLVAVGLQSGRKAASIKGGSAVAETIANNFDQAGSADSKRPGQDSTRSAGRSRVSFARSKATH